MQRIDPQPANQNSKTVFRNFSQNFSAAPKGGVPVRHFLSQCVWLAMLTLGIFCALRPSAAPAQSALNNGAMSAGTLAVNAQDTWAFTANAGDGLMIRVGATSFAPHLQLLGPNGAVVGDAKSANSFVRDVVLSLQATNAGNYVAVINSQFAGGNGAYSVTLAQSPATFVVSAGDEGGTLTSGVANNGTIAVGDLDMWSFTANAGDSLMLRMGTTAFAPWLRLYGPNGVLVSEALPINSFTRDVVLSLQVTNAGNYTLVAGSYYAGGSGGYSLTLAQSPEAFVVSAGDEGGVLPNGAANNGTIAVGDLDMWSFTAGAGDSLMLRMGTTAFAPWLRLYGPTGALVAETLPVNTFTRDVVMTLQATNAGNYTLVTSSYYSGGSGGYLLTLAQSPEAFVVPTGEQGGALANGAANTGTIDVGDLDMWSFTAGAGDSLMLRMGTTAFAPWLRLYGPTGALVAETLPVNTFTRDVVMTLQATNAGNYMLVTSSYYSGGSGGYSLTLAQSPEAFVVSAGDEGGGLTNGVANTGTIGLGDLDMWSFTANAGDGLMVRMGTTAFAPWLRLYGPTGALVAETLPVNTFTRDVVMTLQATNAGNYTLVTGSYYSGGSGGYSLTLAQSPEAFVVSPGDEGGPLVNGFALPGVLGVGDLDMWSFFGTYGDSNVLQIASTNFSPWLRVYGPDGSLVKEVTSANSFVRTLSLSQTITNTGPYTAVLSASAAGQSGTYTIRQSRVPPDLNLPPTQIIDEGATLNVSINAQDPEIPAKPLTFALLSAPPGMTLTANGSTNATLTWATTEADGPSTNVIVATVTDIVNGKNFIRTNSFIVVVNEVNIAPQLSVPLDQVIDELTPLSGAASAIDADIPGNPLTYSLIAPPAGMTIDANTGAISWSPTEAQGPSVNTITVVVTDDSPSAVNAKHLSATNSFTVTVREINTPPQLVVPANQTIDELSSLNVAASATDGDLPANGLTFSFAGAVPAGMAIDPTSGAITWTPIEAQGPSTNVIGVVVTDNNPVAANAKQLSVTNSFTVVVREINTPPQLTMPANQVITELTALNVTASATDSDLPANTLTFSLNTPPTGMSIDAVSGAITWTPTEAQGPSTNVISVVVTDNNPNASNAKQLSVTNSFTVVVNEVNTAPVLPAQGDRTIDELTLLTVANNATDVDLPANSLTYALAAAPSNAVISATGVITWTPTEAQGPSTNTFTTVVTDNGSPNLSATNTFTVIVREVNVAPVLQNIADQTSRTGVPLVLQAVATDADLPANTLKFSLDQAPTNFTINASNGAMAWTPGQNNVGTHPVTVRVTDDGSPSLNATVTFQITVTTDEYRLDIHPFPGGLIQVDATGALNRDYELQKSIDLKTWDKLSAFRITASPYSYVDLESATNALRFYRLLLKP